MLQFLGEVHHQVTMIKNKKKMTWFSVADSEDISDEFPDEKASNEEEEEGNE